MKTIHKVQFGTFEELYNRRCVGGSKRLHRGAKPIHLEKQGDVITLWAEVNTSEPLADYQWHFVGTGLPIPDEWQHLGTIQTGGFVWHFYWSPGG